LLKKGNNVLKTDFFHLIGQKATLQICKIFNRVDHTCRNYPSVNIAKYASRKPLYIEPETQFCLPYSPNYDAVKQRLDKYVSLMSKASPRKDIEKKPYYTNESIYEFDEYVKNNKSAIYTR